MQIRERSYSDETTAAAAHVETAAAEANDALFAGAFVWTPLQLMLMMLSLLG